MTTPQDMLAQAVTKLKGGDLPAAEALLRQVLKIQPQNARAMMFLGILASQTGHPDAAEKLLSHAIELDPGLPMTYYNLGLVLERDGRVDEAISYYLQAIARRPDDIPSLINLGNCYKYVGETGTAFAQYRKVLELDPANAEVRRNLVMAKRFESYDDDAVAVERQLADPTLSTTRQLHLHFALGKIHEDLGNYPESFEHYRQANALKRSTFEYDIEYEEKQSDLLENALTKEAWTDIPSSGIGDETPIFILGMPRSGTSLTEQILASRPGVHAAGELELLRDCVTAHPRIVQQGYPNAVLDFSVDDVTQLGQCYLDGIRRLDDKASRITDKMPHNFLMLGLILKILPKAKIIHCKRDPLDTCMSCYTLLFSEGQHYSYDLEELGRYYRSYEKVMAHWKTLVGASILEVEYESLTADPEPQVKRLLDFCGLEWDESALNFHRSKRAVKTASATQVREPIHKRSVRRGERYRPFLGPLIDALNM